MLFNEGDGRKHRIGREHERKLFQKAGEIGDSKELYSLGVILLSGEVLIDPQNVYRSNALMKLCQIRENNKVLSYPANLKAIEFIMKHWVKYKPLFLKVVVVISEKNKVAIGQYISYH